MKDITQFQIRELIKNLDKQGYGYETKNKVKLIMVDMFNKAMLDEFVRRNPAKGISVKRKDKKDRRDIPKCCNRNRRRTKN